MKSDAARRAARAYYERNKEVAKRRAVDHNRRRRYGITPEQVQALVEVQRNCCALCERPFSKTPNVDHCHTTGRIRGLLCRECNLTLGHLEGRPPAFQKNVDRYLKP